MHEPYDEDDEYDDDQYNYDYSDQYDPYKFYFKFDIDANSSLSDWLTNFFKDIGTHSISNIPGFPVVSFPVNDYYLNTASGYNSLLYLGNNQYGETIYKHKHFICNRLKQEYILHLQNHAKHFISQPLYYKGLFDVLN